MHIVLAIIGAGLGLASGIFYDAHLIGCCVACALLAPIPFLAIAVTWINDVTTGQDS